MFIQTRTYRGIFISATLRNSCFQPCHSYNKNSCNKNFFKKTERTASLYNNYNSFWASWFLAKTGNSFGPVNLKVKKSLWKNSMTFVLIKNYNNFSHSNALRTQLLTTHRKLQRNRKELLGIKVQLLIAYRQVPVCRW